MDPLNDNLTALLHKSGDPFVESLWKDLSKKERDNKYIEYYSI